MKNIDDKMTKREELIANFGAAIDARHAADEAVETAKTVRTAAEVIYMAAYTALQAELKKDKADD